MGDLTTRNQQCKSAFEWIGESEDTTTTVNVGTKCQLAAVNERQIKKQAGIDSLATSQQSTMATYFAIFTTLAVNKGVNLGVNKGVNLGVYNCVNMKVNTIVNSSVNIMMVTCITTQVTSMLHGRFWINTPCSTVVFS